MIEREPHLQYISDEKGNIEGVIVPIEVWREILSERETAYLLDSAAMKQRLLEAMQRTDGIPFEQALEKLGI
jgi:PHD/YefM family antitoxin component YafN of YafNO toxin-antitoxin module